MRHLLGILPLLCFMAPSESTGGPSFDEATKHDAPPPPAEAPTASAPAPESEPTPTAGSPEPAAPAPDSPVPAEVDTAAAELAAREKLPGDSINAKSPMPSEEELAVLRAKERENEVASLASFFHGQLLANSQLSVGRGLSDASVSQDFAAMAFAQAEAHLAERDKRRAA